MVTESAKGFSHRPGSLAGGAGCTVCLTQPSQVNALFPTQCKGTASILRSSIFISALPKSRNVHLVVPEFLLLLLWLLSIRLLQRNFPSLLLVSLKMAELVAFGASIIAFVQLADRVINLSKFYLECLQDCPHEIRVILVEISSLKAILQSLSFLIGTSGSACKLPDLLQQLSGQDGPVEGCREAIASLEQLLPPDVKPTARKRRKLEVAVSQLAWPLKQSKARKLLDEIMRYKASISFALTSETM